MSPTQLRVEIHSLLLLFVPKALGAFASYIRGEIVKVSFFIPFVHRSYRNDNTFPAISATFAAIWQKTVLFHQLVCIAQANHRCHYSGL